RTTDARRAGPPGAAGPGAAGRGRPGGLADAELRGAVQPGSGPGAPHQPGGGQPALRPGPAAAAGPPPRRWPCGGATMTESVAPPDAALEALLGRVADEFTERLNRGEQPDIEDYARRYPEIGGLLRQVLAALQVMGPADLDPAAAGGGPEA